MLAPFPALVISYRQGHGRYEETYGEFLYNTEQVEQQLEAHLQENPHLVNNEEEAILNWIQHRDVSLWEPTDVPDPWYRFQYVANDMARTGNTKIRCLKCNAEIGPDLLVKNDDRGKPGWNFDRLVCPSGHNLLVVDSIHLCICR